MLLTTDRHFLCILLDLMLVSSCWCQDVDVKRNCLTAHSSDAYIVASMHFLIV